jgi:hypothetical protein
VAIIPRPTWRPHRHPRGSTPRDRRACRLKRTDFDPTWKTGALLEQLLFDMLATYNIIIANTAGC